MSIAEQIYEVAKPLPESLALEALHFIEYLNRSRRDVRLGARAGNCDAACLG
ncbi:MAG: hypothetical protein WAO71_13645 [Gallionella sp.]